MALKQTAEIIDFKISPRAPYQCSVGLSEELWHKIDIACQDLKCSRGEIIEHLIRVSLRLPLLYSTGAMELYFKNNKKN